MPRTRGRLLHRTEKKQGREKDKLGEDKKDDKKDKKDDNDDKKDKKQDKDDKKEQGKEKEHKQLTTSKHLQNQRQPQHHAARNLRLNSMEMTGCAQYAWKNLRAMTESSA